MRSAGAVAALIALALVSLAPPAVKAEGGTIRPTVGWHISGSVTVSRADAQTIAIVAHIDAPETELVRPGGEANLLWNLVTAPCVEVVTASAGSVTRLPYQVLARVEPMPDAPGRQTVRFVVDWPTSAQSLAVAAFVNGGGPLVACGEVPLVGPAGQLPGTGGSTERVPALFAVVGIALLLAGCGWRMRWQPPIRP